MQNECIDQAKGRVSEGLGKRLAWAWCLSSNPARGSIAVQARQVRVIADAYGIDADARVLLPEAIAERVRRNVGLWSGQLERPDAILTAPEKVPELIAWSIREQRYVEAHCEELKYALR